MAFELTSPVFESGGEIPERHTRRGENISPFLQWQDPPAGTQSYVLVMEDADATTIFRHWAVYDIPKDRRQLAEGRSSKARTEDLPHAYNDFGNLHYDGPDLPEGSPLHTYRFRLAALNVPTINIAPGADAATVWEFARHLMLGEAELRGTFGGRDGAAA
ncbi:YbhB/YbcL family Raf kinase inhibitor-like protein [Sinorhizobium numidicum]|uniref:YbhB/YbcL family Raf kinase inhibitor-like protein n=1 Tax=Sinorhizobium numidicum TaxID=680248 RepID=A0ABY8CPE5_9HYPH|nr:YbhB/YbcL family Raf kinase inhibitor-like protein [Sinorhizobium numidicum]WEX74509.1 YbhB/YbcL family Raf kinase inhibitor-like protein [Sinorhizobium numidicum]WEX80499.1 YbhB/YbcL family Raf kinase inhibitor-like protein [Sinorhizobium numidicum]